MELGLTMFLALLNGILGFKNSNPDVVSVQISPYFSFCCLGPRKYSMQRLPQQFLGHKDALLPITRVEYAYELHDIQMFGRLQKVALPMKLFD